MFDKLDSEARLLLLRFVCAFAWADLELKETEERFVRSLVEKLDLGEEESAQVDDWLITAPSPESVDPKLIPAEHKRIFIEAVRAVMYVDGDVDEDERAQLDALKAALQS
ncbi:MAG: TerB family tellurite resistance protein [Polyangiaceae bacterium]